MRKEYLMIIALVMLGLASCEEKKQPVTEEEPTVEIVPVKEMPGNFEVHGVIGDGSSMNVIEFISDDGDTLYITKNAQTVMGGLVVGDELELLCHMDKDEVVAQTAVNLTSLQHLWTQKGANGQNQSIELNTGGRVTTYNMKTEYDFWEVKNGLLLLRSPKELGEEAPAAVDSFEILQLTPDSLVLMNGDMMTEFTRYN